MIEQDGKSGRGWMQFSLRTLLTVMLIAATFFAGRVSVRRELERLRAAELEWHGKYVEEHVRWEDAQGKLVHTKEQLRAAGGTIDGMVTKILRLERELDSKAIEGLWSGSWGGGESDGVVIQPVIAELFIEGDQVELYGFPNVDRLTGRFRLEFAKRMHITPTVETGSQRTLKAIHYECEIKGNALTLIDSRRIPIFLERVRVAQDPLGNAQVELVAAAGINDARDLIVTEFNVLRAARSGTTYFKPEHRSLKIKQATILLIQEAGWKKVTIAEARDMMHESTPVVVTYRDHDCPSLHQFHRLWNEAGPPSPDSEPVWRMFSQILRPGALVFVLSARENVPQP